MNAGDRVVCIDATGVSRLVRGQEYTVTQFSPHSYPSRGGGVSLEGFSGTATFCADRFEMVVSQKYLVVYSREGYNDLYVCSRVFLTRAELDHFLQDRHYRVDNATYYVIPARAIEVWRNFEKVK